MGTSSAPDHRFARSISAAGEAARGEAAGAWRWRLHRAAKMAEKRSPSAKRNWVPASISRIASATGSLVAAAAGSVSRCALRAGVPRWATPAPAAGSRY